LSLSHGLTSSQTVHPLSWPDPQSEYFSFTPQFLFSVHFTGR